MPKWKTFLIIFLCHAGSNLGHDLSQPVGQTLVIGCNSSAKVDCVWKIDGKYLKISNRYSYVKDHGKNTTDCSLQINPFHESDVGNWSCWNFSKNDQNGNLLNFSNVIIDAKYHEIVIKPAPKSIYTQQNHVKLDCKFNQRIGRCHWLRNAGPVLIASRYRYTNNEEGHFSTDCSVEISRLEEIDLGIWQCSSASNDRIGYVQSNPAWLNISNPFPSSVSRKINIEEHPENQTATLGGEVVLKCAFDAPVHCSWMRNEQVVQIHYKYQYTSQGKGKLTKNCSISISNINTFDFGSWQCMSAGDDKGPVVKSKKAFITDRKEYTTSIIESPRLVTASLGKSHKFDCNFNTNVDCIWQRNGLPVQIDQRYQYVSEENGRNTTSCSIQIGPVEISDFGKWTCGNLVNSGKEFPQFGSAALHRLKIPTIPKIRLGPRPVSEIRLFSSNPYDINCFSNNGYPAPTLYWAINGQRISGILHQIFDDSEISYNTTLSWNSTGDNEILRNSSELQCAADHLSFNQTISNSVKTFKSTMPSHPVIFLNGTKVAAIFPFHTTGLTCVSVNGHPAPNLFWLIGGKKVTGFAERRSKTDSLFNVTLHWNSTVDHLEIWNGTVVKCVAEHPDFTSPMGTNLKIKRLQKPEIRFRRNAVTELRMASLTAMSDLSCTLELDGFAPKPNMYWECDGRKVPEKYQKINSNSTTCTLCWNSTSDQNLLRNSTQLSCVAEYSRINERLKTTLNLSRDIPVKKTINVSTAATSIDLSIILPAVLIAVVVLTFVIACFLKRYLDKFYFKYIANGKV